MRKDNKYMVFDIASRQDVLFIFLYNRSCAPYRTLMSSSKSNSTKLLEFI